HKLHLQMSDYVQHLGCSSIHAASGAVYLMRRLRVLSGLRFLHFFCRPDKAFTPHPALVA
ncbi:hypothetical protein, partial [Escherichia coli]|uniref:hypothetical protein n=1 Tax=Escherichia coli TaxID=562 RepID=UPI001CDABDC6